MIQVHICNCGYFLTCIINSLLSTRDTASLVRNIEVLLGLSLRVWHWHWNWFTLSCLSSEFRQVFISNENSRRLICPDVWWLIPSFTVRAPILNVKYKVYSHHLSSHGNLLFWNPNMWNCGSYVRLAVYTKSQWTAKLLEQPFCFKENTKLKM